mmetsp:Transcript_5738/g.8480  ORF Transcript_5738/g.8480 Transcript_5738/m.8480 type:complete len:149 (-) Transcript_5738:226-672(-)
MQIRRLAFSSKPLQVLQFPARHICNGRGCSFLFTRKGQLYSLVRIPASLVQDDEAFTKAFREAGKNVNLETHLTGVLSNRIHPLGRMLERFSYDFLKKYDGSEVSKHFENKSSLIFHTFFQAYIRLEGSCSPCAEIKVCTFLNTLMYL